MTDSLGHRRKFGVIAPSTNTSVQPEFDAMRPFGVINHFEGIYTPDIPLVDAESVNAFLDHVRKDLMPAVDRAMTCQPDFLIMGMSSETFWDGLEGANKLRDRVEHHSGVKVGMGSDACRAALKAPRSSGPGHTDPRMFIVPHWLKRVARNARIPRIENSPPTTVAVDSGTIAPYSARRSRMLRRWLIVASSSETRPMAIIRSAYLRGPSTWSGGWGRPRCS